MGAVRLELTEPEGEGFTVPCNCHYATPPKKTKKNMLEKGIEPSTDRLQGDCSTIELLQLRKRAESYQKMGFPLKDFRSKYRKKRVL
jgi:hypothetical protein